MDLTALFENLVIALGLGLLVGLQRERTDARLAGVRTFPLITVFGVVCGLLGATYGGWIVAAGLAGLAAIVVVSAPRDETSPGVTTDVATLVMYAVGAYLTVGSREVAIAVGAGVAVLLQLKDPLHRFVSRLSEKDLRALMQFALVALVILPALPDRAYGRYGVLNPHRIWLMVVLIVGISLGGYVASKLFGSGAGTVLAGVLGGLISSTATTVSSARRVASTPSLAGLSTVVIAIASTIVFARLVLELAVAVPSSFGSMAPPIAVMFGAMALLSFAAWLYYRRAPAETPSQDDPTELKSALVFGLLYAAVLFVVAATKERYGVGGLYAVAFLSGLTDVDAITLSTAQLVRDGGLEASVGWRVILVAATSNLAFKAAATWVLGGRRLFAPIAAVFGGATVVAALVFLFWPSS